jgi:hypothetical protein
LVLSDLLSATLRAYVRYSDAQRDRLVRRILALRYGPFDPGQRRATWAQVAAAVGVSRSAIQEWRAGEDYRRAEIAYRTLLREEARTDAAGLLQEAMAHVRFLMTHARSDFVQLEAAKLIIQLTQADKDVEERELKGNEQLVQFQKLLLTKKRDAQALRDLGIDPTAIVDMEVRPGGLLPEAVVVQNELAAQQHALLRSRFVDDDDDEPDTDL